MGKRCVIGGCSNTNRDGVSVHKFPKDEALREKWDRFVRYTRKDWQHATEFSVICGAHFQKPQDYENFMKWEMGFTRQLDLKKGAIPSIRIPVKPFTEQESTGENPESPRLAQNSAMLASPSSGNQLTPAVQRTRAVHKLSVARVRTSCWRKAPVSCPIIALPPACMAIGIWGVFFFFYFNLKKIKLALVGCQP